MGVPELLVIAALLGALAIPILLTLFLRRRFPERLWLGVLIAFLFAPIGHLYLPRSVLYVVGLFVLPIVLHSVWASVWATLLITHAVSAFLMYFRVKSPA